MRRFGEVFTAAATCAVLAAVPACAHARTRRLHVGVRVSQGPWSARLTPAGRLPDDPSQSGNGLENDGAVDAGPVVGGDTLATIGILSRSSQQPVLLVYTKRSTGWSHAGPPARFRFPSGFSVFSMAAADGLVAFNGSDPTGGTPTPACATPVFVAGTAGFHGTLTPTACLSGDVSPIVATPHTVVAMSSPSTLEVFTEPAGGWAGVVAPSATLQASNGEDLESASLSGSTIAAVGQSTGQVHLFTEPAGGWSGLVDDSAQIQIPGGAAAATLSGRTLTALGIGQTINPEQLDWEFGVFVVRQPAEGWQSATVSQPRAYVRAGPQDPDFGPLQGVQLGATTAFTNILGCGDQGSPPCETGVWAIGGLGSDTAAVPALPTAPSVSTEQGDGTPLASDGTVLVLGETGVQFYTVADTPPAHVVHASLTGVSTRGGQPVLRLGILAAAGSSAVASARVLVPPQLGGRGVPRAIALKPAHRETTLTLRRLSESAALRRAVRHIEVHGGRIALSVAVELLNAAGRSSQSDVELTLARVKSVRRREP